jgi:hypothetical protein
MDDTHWVYVFAKLENGILTNPVKVGISKSVDHRMNNIQTACPFKIGLAWVFEMPSRSCALDLERAFHETQAEKRLHGEWFNYDPISAIHILCIGLRSLLSVTVDSPRLVDDILDVSGVFWAEKRFGLVTPNQTVEGDHGSHTHH